MGEQGKREGDDEGEAELESCECMYDGGGSEEGDREREMMMMIKVIFTQHCYILATTQCTCHCPLLTMVTNACCWPAN